MKVWVGFSTSRHWISAAIRWFTRSRASHAFIVYESHELATRVILEAHYTFRALPYDFFARRNKIVAEVEIANCDKAAVVRKTAQFLGTDYDYTGIVGGIVVSIGRWLKRRWSNPTGDPHTVTCSEAVTRALKAGLYPGVETLDPEATTPQDLMEFFGVGK